MLVGGGGGGGIADFSKERNAVLSFSRAKVSNNNMADARH